MKPNKNIAIDALMFSYGVSKKRALEMFKTWDAVKLQYIVDGYKQTCKSAFYND